MNIYLSGSVGTSGALKLYKEQEALFASRFPSFFRKQIEEMNQTKCEVSLAKYSHCIYICTITDRGLFGALWDGCEELNCGCEVFLKRIPIRQEVVEITELTGDNPYEIESFGNLLIFSEESFGPAAQEETGEQKTEFSSASVLKEPELTWIGKTTESKDRVVVMGEHRRFLTPPKRQLTDQARQKEDRRRAETQ